MSELVGDTQLVLVANAKDGTIATFRLTDGRLERLAVTAGLTGCSTFAVDPARNLVHAAVKGADDGEHPGIATLSLDRGTGELTPRSRLDLPEGSLSYVALTRDGTGLLAASYGAGYGISCPVRDGVVGEPVSQVHFPNLHSVLASPDGEHAYFVSLGADLVAQYALGADMGLSALEPATVAAPEGSGPRHLVITPDGTSVYVLTEFTGEVLSYARDTGSGTLRLLGGVPAYDPSKGLVRSRFGLDPMANHAIWGADLHLGGAGGETAGATAGGAGSGPRYLWASERTESTLGAVAVNPDGTLSAPSQFTTTEPQPRGFDVSPDGTYLVAAGERSTTVSLYAVAGDRLELLQRAETGNGANWVRFV